MSREGSFTLTSDRPRTHQSGRLSAPGRLSLAGNLRTVPDQTPKHPHRPQSFVSNDYESFNAPYEVEQKPLWSLARPLPRVVRPGMRKDRTREQLKQHRNNHLRRAQTTTSGIPGDGIRRIISSDQFARPPILQVRSQISAPPLPPSSRHEDAIGQGILHSVRSATDAEHGVEQFGSEIQNVQTNFQSTAHDFVEDQEDFRSDGGLHLTQSEEDHIHAGRQRVQEMADVAHHVTHPPSWPYGLDVDWEEFHPELDHQLAADSESTQQFLNTWAKYRYRFREPLAEFVGTSLFMLFGLCASISARLTTSSDNINKQYGDFLSVNLAWSWGAMVAIYCAGGVSGAHLNPVTSFTLSVYRGFPWRLCWKYVLAQLFAGFVAAALTYAVYNDAINLSVRNGEGQFNSEVGDNTTEPLANFNVYSGIFYTAPHSSIPISTSFTTQLLASCLYTLSVFALGDDKNAAPTPGINPFIVGLLVFVICAAFPFNTPVCLSPARDFGPRLFVLMITRDPQVFKQSSGYWAWGTWLATSAGSLLGAGIYDLTIFTGPESPVNYQWGWKIRQGLDNLLEKGEKNKA